MRSSTNTLIESLYPPVLKPEIAYALRANMTDLIAQGEKKLQRWRRRLPRRADGRARTRLRRVFGRLGRSDLAPSRRVVLAARPTEKFRNCRQPGNPIFADGTEKTHFEVRPGEQFVIGQTRFVVTDDKIHVSLDLPQPAHEQAFSADFLQQLQFRNSRARIDVLARLPEVISGATSDRELFVRLVNLLLSGIAGADAAALVQVAPSSSGEKRGRGAALGSTCDGGKRFCAQRTFDSQGDRTPRECAPYLERRQRIGIHRGRERRLGFLYARFGRGVLRLGTLRGGAVGWFRAGAIRRQARPITRTI